MSSLSVAASSVYRGRFEIPTPTLTSYPRFIVPLPKSGWMVSHVTKDSSYIKIELMAPLETQKTYNKMVVISTFPQNKYIQNFYEEMRTSLSEKCKFKELRKTNSFTGPHPRKIIFLWKVFDGATLTGIVATSQNHFLVLIYINKNPNSLECAQTYFETATAATALKIIYFSKQWQ